MKFSYEELEKIIINQNRIIEILESWIEGEGGDPIKILAR